MNTADIRAWLEGLGLSRYAAAFEALRISPEEAQQLGDEELAEIGVASLVHRRKIRLNVNSAQAASIGATPADASLALTVLERFPFPIAYGYRRVVQPESAINAADNVFYTYTALLRFVSLTFIGQFLNDGEQNPAVAKSLRRLQRPTLEDWFTALTTCANHLFQDSSADAPFQAGGPFSRRLLVAARQLSRLAHDDDRVHERLRTLRNTRYHGNPWTEEECAARLPELRALLDATLELFAPLAEIELLRRSPRGMLRLLGADDTFLEEPVPDARIDELFDQSETVLTNREGALLPLYPLFLAPDAPLAEGYTEPLLSFDGHGRKSAVYLGVRTWTARQDTLSRYEDLLRSKNIDPRFTKGELTPWGVSDWARETSRGVIENLRGVKYFPDIYQERPTLHAAPPTRGDEGLDEKEPSHGIEDVIRRWLEHGRESALIVAAEAGSGKTSLLCHLTEHFLRPEQPCVGGPTTPEYREDNQDCVLLLLGDSIRGRTSIFERIRDGLGFSGDPAQGGITGFEELIATWEVVANSQDLQGAERRILLFIDALNEASDPRALFAELSALAATAATANSRARQSGGVPWIRLLVSVRAEHIETLQSRWSDSRDTTFFHLSHNFTHFPDREGQPAPYLSLRRFTPQELCTAYLAYQSRAGEFCAAPWEEILPSTRELLRHPLMLALFHRAFAGTRPTTNLAEPSAVWDVWLERTFDPMRGGSRLRHYALDLADACIDGGHEQIPDSLSHSWHQRWCMQLGNDPVRIASELDPMERLCEAGILRRVTSGAYDWVSDPVAEEVFRLTLQRRDASISGASLAAWLALPQTTQLDGAIARVGCAIWRKGDIKALAAILGCDHYRMASMLADIVVNVAPRGSGNANTHLLDIFRDRLIQCCELAAATGDAAKHRRLASVLSEEVHERFRWRDSPPRLIVHECALSLTKRLLEIEPDNTTYQLDLAISYHNLGDIDLNRDSERARASFEQALAIVRRLADAEPGSTICLLVLANAYDKLGYIESNRDPERARLWYEQALAILRDLAEAEPDNTIYQYNLSVAYIRFGNLDRARDPERARAWFEQALANARRLAEAEPDNTICQRDLALSYHGLGDIDHDRDPDRAREWYEHALAIVRRLTEAEPDNTGYLHNLSLLYVSLGNIDLARDPDRARACFEQALAIARRLAEAERDNTIYQYDLSLSYVSLGEFDGTRDPESARLWYEQAFAILRDLAEAEPDNTDYLQNLSVLYEKLGDIDRNRDPERARGWYEQALAIARRLAEAEPDNTFYQRDLALSYGKLGDIDRKRDPERARGWYEHELAIRRRLAEAEPDNTFYQRDLALSYGKLGDIERNRDPERARGWYEHELAIRRRLAEAQPDSTIYQRELMLSYGKLGDIERNRDPERARGWYEQALAIARRLAEAEPDNTDYLQNLSVLYEKLGDIDRNRDPERAPGWYEQGLAIRRRLAEAEPDNTAYMQGLAESCNTLGNIDRARDPERAQAWFEQGLAIRRRLAEAEPDNITYLRDIALSFIKLGDVGANREPERARVWYEQGLAIHRRLAETEPDAAVLRDLWWLYEKLGDIDQTRAPEHARGRYEQGLALARRLAEAEPDEPIFLHDLAVSYERLGIIDEARDPERSRVWFEHALASARQCAALDPTNTASQLEMSRYLIRLGDFLEVSSPEECLHCYQEAADIRAAVVAADPQGIEPRQLLGSAFCRLAEHFGACGDLDKERDYSQQAHSALLDAVNRAPNDADALYGLACTSARLQLVEDALSSLSRAAQLGWADADHAASDPDLATLSGLPAFSAILETMRSGQQG